MEKSRPEVVLDVHGEEFCRHNYEIYDDLRRRCPVAWSNEHGGHWLLTDYDSVFEATRDDELFYSSDGAGIRDPALDAGYLADMPPIQTDPPVTGQMRQLTSRFLSPSAVAGLEDEIRVIADELIDEFIEGGVADLVGELTTPLPARVILRMMNFDESRWPEWVVYVHTLIHGPEGGADPDAVREQMRAAIISEMATRQQRGLGAEDMVGSILAGQVDGRDLEPAEKFGYVLLLLFGGMDTTSGLTGNALVAMSRQPELKQQLIVEPDLIGTATEEFLRHGSPTQGLARTVKHDTEFHGQQLRAGDKVLLLWAAANRDPAVFDHPADIRLDRHPNRHMAFGVGQHRCLGSNLARTMFKIMITRILDRLPDFEMTVDEPVRYTDAANVYAPRSLPVRFTPGRRVGAGATDKAGVTR